MKLSYMMEVQRGDTVIYRYNPPADALEAGVVKRVMLGADYEAACVYVQEQNALMAELLLIHSGRCRRTPPVRSVVTPVS